MKIPPMIAAECAASRPARLSIVALIALMCVPVLYGGLYLWANQNPYANLDRIPAAIVVDDSGTTVNGTPVNYGDQVANDLVRDGAFDWHRVASGSAASGVDNARYDFSITFPAGFSDALASASGTSPRQARVVLTTNDTNSYLASTIGTQAAEKIRTSIVKQVNEQAAQQFLLGLATIRSNLVTALGGANQLVDGSANAQSGASTLADGTAQLASGSQQLNDSLGRLADGAAQVSSGAAQVAAGNDQLAAKASQAGAAASQVASSAPEVGQQLLARLQASGATQAQLDQVSAALAQLDSRGAERQCAGAVARRPGEPARGGRRPGVGRGRAGGRRIAAGPGRIGAARVR